MSQVIIIGQNYSTTYSLVRSLGEKGFICSVVRCGPDTSDKLVRSFAKPDVFSRYVKRSISVSRKSKEHIINRIIEEFGDSRQKKILLPADDFSASLLSESADEFAPFFFFPDVHGRDYKLNHLMKKNMQKQMASLYEIPVAKNWEIQVGYKKVPALPEDLTYPCIVKPLASIGFPKSYIQRCDSTEELTLLLSKISQECSCPILIEQYINVENEYTIPGISDGKNVFIPAFIKKLLISKGEHKGVTIKGLVENSDEHDSLVVKLAQLILSTGFDGIFDIEVFFSQGKYYLNEINFRNGAAAYALTYAGVNLPVLWAESVIGKNSISAKKDSIKEVSFVSDKAALEYMLAGFCSYKEYKCIGKSVDLSLICNSFDWPASLAFFILKINLIKKAIVKWITKRN